jgi:hypothetical protein
MTQQTTGVAVLTTELPATDRRALSQAWYSALHLAEQPPRARSAQSAPLAPAQLTAIHGAASEANGRGRDAGATARGNADRDAGTRRDNGARRDILAHRDAGAPHAALARERRAPKSELARRIERALADRPRSVPASFAVTAAGGRVRILVRSDGARTRVVAVCAPPLRERVERALAQARFALAARGLRAEVA